MTTFKWYRKRPQVNSPNANLPSVKLIHSFYRSKQPSGENETVLYQLELLGAAGFDVELLYLDSDDLVESRRLEGLTALGLMTGHPAAAPPDGWWQDADLLHIHNTFPNVSNSALARLGIPLVSTAHNYRAFCANGLFLRDGHLCTECTSHGFERALRYGCYQESRLRTLPVVALQKSNRSLQTLMSQCVTVLVPGDPMAKILMDLGVRNTHVLSNPVANQALEDGFEDNPRKGWLFTGRLTAEKGILELLALWPTDRPLTVIGDGPLRAAATTYAAQNSLPVTFVGSLPNPKVRALMRKNLGLVFSSIALEGSPLVYGEAMQAGLPVVAAAGSNFAAQVTADQTGETFNLSDRKSLVTALNQVLSHRHLYSEAARSVYTERYTPDVWIQNITTVYRNAAGFSN